MASSYAIESPFGITVFGSYVLRVEPDIASVRFAISRLQEHPRDAFSETRTAVQNVNQFLTSAAFSDFGSSRIGLAVTKKYIDGENQFVGHTASVEFQLILRDLDRLEELLIGVVDAGANEITAVEYTTRNLKDLRADARKQAVAAATEKADIYCASANVRLGKVLHINDMKPSLLGAQS